MKLSAETQKILGNSLYRKMQTTDAATKDARVKRTHEIKPFVLRETADKFVWGPDNN